MEPMSPCLSEEELALLADGGTALELVLIEELSVPEVATRTGLAPAQIYKLKAAALKRVRAILERLGTGPIAL